MYISLKDIKDFLAKTAIGNENPGIFIEYMNKCYEPTDVVIDEDGDIIIII